MRKLIVTVTLLIVSAVAHAQPVIQWKNLRLNYDGQFINQRGEIYNGKAVAFTPENILEYYKGPFKIVVNISTNLNRDSVHGWYKWIRNSRCQVDIQNGYLHNKLECREGDKLKLEQVYHEGHPMSPMGIYAYDETGFDFIFEHQDGELHGLMFVEGGNPKTDIASIGYAGGIRHGLTIFYNLETGNPRTMVEYEYGQVSVRDACNEACR